MLAESVTQLAGWQEDARRVLRLDAGLPAKPFAADFDVAITEYHELLGIGLVEVVDHLMSFHKDAYMTFLAVHPPPHYYQEAYAFNPGFRVARSDDLETAYWDGLAHEPSGDPTGALAYTADVIAVWGEQQSWVMWGQRDWNLALVAYQRDALAGLASSVPFLTPQEALESFVDPFGSGAPSASARREFLANYADLEGA